MYLPLAHLCGQGLVHANLLTLCLGLHLWKRWDPPPQNHTDPQMETGRGKSLGRQLTPCHCQEVLVVLAF